MNIGNKIHELRKKKGITQEALASALSLSPQAVSKWESGLTYPDITMIPAIAGYFEISLDVLFDFDATKIKENVEKILAEAWEYFFSDTEWYAETVKAALKDYPGNEDLLEKLIEAYRRLNADNRYTEEIISLCQKLLTESKDFPRVCRMKELQAQLYLKKNEYGKAKEILETLPTWLVPIKDDAFASILKGKDKANGASMAKWIYMAATYRACMNQGNAWYRMEEEGVTFQSVSVDEYLPFALQAYKEGAGVIELFLGEPPHNENRYVWEGMQTTHYVFYQRIAACHKRLGNTEECEKAIDEAYRIVSSSWFDYEENKDEIMGPFYQYLKDYDLEEYIR